MQTKKDVRLILLSLYKAPLEPTIHSPTAGVGPQRMLSQEEHRNLRQGRIYVEVGELAKMVQHDTGFFYVIDLCRCPCPLQVAETSKENSLIGFSSVINDFYLLRPGWDDRRLLLPHRSWAKKRKICGNRTTSRTAQFRTLRHIKKDGYIPVVGSLSRYLLTTVGPIGILSLVKAEFMQGSPR